MGGNEGAALIPNSLSVDENDSLILMFNSLSDPLQSGRQLSQSKFMVI
jgi:hypothetical protein